MDDLVQWLTAQLAEDERIARACPGDGEWHAGEIDYVADLSPEKCDHIAAHDPARVLREVDSKRQLLALHGSSEFGTWVGDDDDQEPACSTCGDLTVRFPCKTLRLLALPYSDRPGYQEGWAP